MGFFGKKSRVIDGKRYELADTSVSKRELQKDAKAFRRAGNSVRIIKHRDSQGFMLWHMYMR